MAEGLPCTVIVKSMTKNMDGIQGSFGGHRTQIRYHETSRGPFRARKGSALVAGAGFEPATSGL
jgi:hypothetical protein